MVHGAPIARRAGRAFARLFAVLVLLGVAAAVFLIVTSPPGFLKSASSGTPAPHRAAHRKLPPYWKVRAGDTFAAIAAKTGLSIDQLQAFNPTVNSMALTPGQRLNLWQHPPKPPKHKAKPPGQMFWTVRPGQSFGSIAAATKISIVTLEQLNPKLKPSALQAGDRVRLHQ